MRVSLSVMVSCLGLAAFGASSGDEIPGEYMNHLASEEFRVREKAQADLLAWARARREPAIEKLYALSQQLDDPEVRQRCLDVLQDLVMDDYLNEGSGYMGIQMQPMIVNVPGDPQMRVGVRVSMVMPDSAAAKAGIQVGDMIVGIGDQIWREQLLPDFFTEEIKKLKPKTKVKLKMLRNEVPMEVEVTLGRRPMYADRRVFGDEDLDPDALEREEKEAYFRDWLRRRKSVK